MIILTDKEGMFIDAYTTLASYARDYRLTKHKYAYIRKLPWIDNKRVYKDHILVKYTPIK